MEFPPKSQTSPVLNPEVCGLCGNQVLSECLSNEVLIGGNLPDNTCQCFFSTVSEIDVPEKAELKSEEKAELPTIHVCDSPSVDPLKSVEEKFCLDKESTTNAEKDDSENGEESNTLELSISSNGYPLSSDEQSDQNLASHRNSTPPNSGEESNTLELSISSNGYPLSADEQSDQNFTIHRNINSSSSGEESKTSSYTNKEESVEQNLDENESKTSSEHKNATDEAYNDSESSPSEEINNQKLRERKSSNTIKISYKNEQNERLISSKLGKFSFENLTRLPVPRPALPRPFPQAHINPVVNMPVPTPFPQNSQRYTNPSMNVPVIRTNIPGKSSVIPREQLSTSYHQEPNIEKYDSSSFSKKLRAHSQQLDSEANPNKKLERIENWLGEVECNPPDEEPSSECAEAEYTFSGISTDERSSGEISEEENRRQRSLRHPPRNVKKNRQK